MNFSHTYELGVKVTKKVLRECKETLVKITLETLRLKKTTTLKSRMMMESKSQRMEKTWLKEKRSKYHHSKTQFITFSDYAAVPELDNYE